MWFDKKCPGQTTPLSFSNRGPADRETSVLQTWVQERARLRPPSEADNPAETPDRGLQPEATEFLDQAPQPPQPAPAPVEFDRAAVMRVQAEVLKNLSQAIRDVHVLRSSLNTQLESQLVLLAAQMARKVIHREISVDPSILTQLAREGIRALGDSQNVIVRLGPLPDTNQTEQLVQQIQDEHPDTRVFIDSEREPGACIVEAQLGRVDESVEARLDNVLCNILGDQLAIVGPAT